MMPTDLRPLPSARVLAARSGVTLLLLAGLGLLGAGLFLLLGSLMPQIVQQDDVRQMMADLQVTADDLARMAYAFAIGLIVYTLVGATLGIGLLAAGPWWRKPALVFAITACGLLGLMAASTVVRGAGGTGLFLILLIAPHALAVWWLLGAATAPTASVVPLPPTSYRPMQDYYTPPVPPMRTS